MKKILRDRRALLAGSLAAAALVLALAPFNMGGCSQQAITGLVQSGQKTIHAVSMGPKDEPNLGRNVTIAVTSRYGVSDDDNLSRYVTLVGMTVATASPAKNLHWYFGVLDSDHEAHHSSSHDAARKPSDAEPQADAHDQRSEKEHPRCGRRRGRPLLTHVSIRCSPP